MNLLKCIGIILLVLLVLTLYTSSSYCDEYNLQKDIDEFNKLQNDYMNGKKNN